MNGKPRLGAYGERGTLLHHDSATLTTAFLSSAIVRRSVKSRLYDPRPHENVNSSAIVTMTPDTQDINLYLFHSLRVGFVGE